MRAGMLLVAFLGLLAGVLLIGYFGLAGVTAALGLVGWAGFMAITLFHLVPMTLCALAWRAQLRQAPAAVWRYVWFRWMRDAGGDLLVMLPAAGELLGIRAMALSGVGISFAVASTVVDLSLELCAQLVFMLLGLAVLVVASPGEAVVYWALAGLAAVLPLVGAFLLAQRLGGFRLFERLALKLAEKQRWPALARASGIDSRIRAIYADRRRVLGAFTVHLLAWLAGIGEAGIALHLMRAPLGVLALVALESLSYALRSAAFFVPAAAGVQEGGYVFLGALFGLGPDVALALSLLKRGRELALGTLALLVWQTVESGRLWQRPGRALGGD